MISQNNKDKDGTKPPDKHSYLLSLTMSVDKLNRSERCLLANVPMMSASKQCCRTLTTDVLSNLPENVVDDILMCLPFQDTVRTSILSKKWRYIWCRLPKLTLDEALWKTQKKLRSLYIYFTEIIFNIFTFHSGPITMFTLCIPDLGMCTKIDNLIYFLFRNGIEHLSLRLPTKGKPYKLPSSFFTYLHLRHLTLEGCLILPPPSFKGFDKLTSMELHDVIISSELLESLISGCSLLEHLALKISYTLRSVVEINAPNLKSFDFDGNIRSICLKSIPLRAKLSLPPWGWYDGANKFYITKLFESFSALEHLHLCNIITLKFVATVAGEVPPRLPFQLNRVKRLRLFGPSLWNLREVSYALCLMGSMPYLQYLEIKVDNSVGVAPETHEVEGFSDVAFNHLMEIKLEGIIGENPQMQLIKLLLAKSPVLVRMKIESGLSVNSASDSSSEKTKNLQESKLLAKISKLKRASPKAEVIVKSLLV